MIRHSDITPDALREKIYQHEIGWGGNGQLKIYGTLHCKSGKRMLVKNRVFFATEKEARELGYRPCGHCLPQDYKKWKHGFI